MLILVTIKFEKKTAKGEEEEMEKSCFQCVKRGEMNDL